MFHANLKYAYLEAQVTKNHSISLGMNATPWIAHMEDLWGYRFVQRTLMDQTERLSITDLGLHGKGSLHNWGEYHWAILNGEGWGHTW